MRARILPEVLCVTFDLPHQRHLDRERVRRTVTDLCDLVNKTVLIQLRLRHFRNDTDANSIRDDHRCIVRIFLHGYAFLLNVAYSILTAIFVNNKLPKGYRTYLMAVTNVPTVIGFAMIAWCDGKAARLVGYCKLPSVRACGVVSTDFGLVVGLTGASNATFVLGLSLVAGNVGGQTKKSIASAAVFLGQYIN